MRAVRRTDVAGYHPDVRVYEIRDVNDDLVALFMGDYFARPSKRSGAWMSSFQSQHKLTLSVAITFTPKRGAKVARTLPVTLR